MIPHVQPESWKHPDGPLMPIPLAGLDRRTNGNTFGMAVKWASVEIARYDELRDQGIPYVEAATEAQQARMIYLALNGTLDEHLAALNELLAELDARDAADANRLPGGLL